MMNAPVQNDESFVSSLFCLFVRLSLKCRYLIFFHAFQCFHSDHSAALQPFHRAQRFNLRVDFAVPDRALTQLPQEAKTRQLQSKHGLRRCIFSLRRKINRWNHWRRIGNKVHGRNGAERSPSRYSVWRRWVLQRRYIHACVSQGLHRFISGRWRRNYKAFVFVFHFFSSSRSLTLYS